jgi:flagellar hook-associated protein 1 FlgK
VSAFSALNTATTALWAQQRALDVTGQNVANANTDGYSRQRADLQSVNGNGVPAIWSVSSEVGGGVKADDVIRVRDAFLEARARAEHGATAALTVQDAAYSDIQDAFREPGTTGLQRQLTDMWAGWGDVMNNSQDQGARSQVLQRTGTLVAGMHTTSGTLTKQWDNHKDALQTLVQDVNATAASIADLNRAIKSATMSKLPVNELADKRDSLVLHLSDQIGASATVRDDGTYDVSVGGTSLVSGNYALTLQLNTGTTPTGPSSAPTQIVTAPGGTVLPVGGAAQAHIAVMTSTIPGYLTQLDGLAQQIAQQLNTVHQSGYDMSGNQGKPLLDDGTGAATVTYTNITAANLTLQISDPKMLAAASLSTTDTGGPISADNGNAGKLYQERLNASGTDTSYRKMIVALGVQASVTATNLSTQTAISQQVDGSRESVSGVNIDEEMTNMLQFQHGYQAASRLVTTIDSMLDTLINHTGLVGQV